MHFALGRIIVNYNHTIKLFVSWVFVLRKYLFNCENHLPEVILTNGNTLIVSIKKHLFLGKITILNGKALENNIYFNIRVIAKTASNDARNPDIWLATKL